MNVRPTRPELDNLKKRSKFYSKGEKLLEIKREQILGQLKGMVNKYFEQRRLIRARILQDFRLLERTYEVIGKQRISVISMLNKLHFNTSIDIKFITRVGVDVPTITLNLNEGKLPAYSFSDTPMHLDFLSQQLKETLKQLLKLAEIDTLFYHLAESYKKIERRINALDDIILPKLSGAINTIEEILEDISQEEFIRMKKIKDLLEETI